MAPELTQHSLDRADGSAVFFDGLFSVLAAVNGPVEVQRRDELPEEAAIEVNIRPISGVGSPRERWLETVVQSVIRSVLLANMHPRTLVQLTLQITREPSLKISRTAVAISSIPALVNASFLALLDAGLPLASVLTAVLLAVNESGQVNSTLDELDLESCQSLHAMAFNQHGEQLLDESSGKFDVTAWNSIFDLARKTCMNAIAPASEDTVMAYEDSEHYPWLRNALQGQADKANAWRQIS